VHFFFVEKIGNAEPTVCHPNPCLNGGTCKENGKGYDCICDVQYTGSQCEGMGMEFVYVTVSLYWYIRVMKLSVFVQYFMQWKNLKKSLIF